jgi:hypothetical protein
MIDRLMTFDEVKSDPFIAENIRWDLEPRHMMEPKFTSTGPGAQVREERPGYLFYIDSLDKERKLYMMRHTASEFGKTLAQIDEAPRDLIEESIVENRDRVAFGMYPVGKRLEAWLKKELGTA